MQYNSHTSKYKTADIGGIKREQFREYKNNHSYKNNVDPSLSHRNLYLDMCPDGCDWFAKIRDAKRQTEEATGRAVRKDAVVICSTVETVPSSWPEDEVKDYFRAKASWFGQYLREHAGCDKDCLLSLAVHLDETNPHATYAWLPMKDGRLQVSNIMTRQFLRDLQKDGQDFSMAWIEEHNLSNNKQLEPLSRYRPESERRHLSEVEYKERQIGLEKKEQDLTVRELTAKTAAALADEKEKEYSDKLTALTGAPDVPRYEKVVKENEELRAELSLKEKALVVLRRERDHFKEMAETWKTRFTDLTHKAGQRLMSALGFDVRNDPSVKEYPSREVSREIADISERLSGRRSAKYRTLPDDDKKGSFKVAYRASDGSYETIKRGFSSRTAADDYRRNISNATKGLSRERDEGLKRK